MFKTALMATVVTMTLTTTANAADGKEIVEKACTGCHAVGVANAPKIGDKAAWDSRKTKGIDILLASVKNGLNAMPPGGMCNDCSDDDYKAAIAYMSK